MPGKRLEGDNYQARGQRGGRHARQEVREETHTVRFDRMDRQNRYGKQGRQTDSVRIGLQRKTTLEGRTARSDCECHPMGKTLHLSLNGKMRIMGWFLGIIGNKGRFGRLLFLGGNFCYMGLWFQNIEYKNRKN